MLDTGHFCLRAIKEVLSVILTVLANFSFGRERGMKEEEEIVTSESQRSLRPLAPCLTTWSLTATQPVYLIPSWQWHTACRRSTWEGHRHYATTSGGRLILHCPLASKQHLYVNPCQQHLEFPCALSSNYSPGPILLYFSFKMETGVSNSVELFWHRVHW